jgi:hypothetical protein
MAGSVLSPADARAAAPIELEPDGLAAKLARLTALAERVVKAYGAGAKCGCGNCVSEMHSATDSLAAELAAQKAGG